MRKAICLLILLGACRRKHVAPVVTEETPAPVEAPAEVPAAQPTTVDDPPPPPPPAPAGHAPTDKEMRAKLERVFPLIGRCMTQNGIVAEGPKYLLLRFTVSPEGKVTRAEVDGHAPANNCVSNVLGELRFEPWSGGPNLVAVPITRDGKPVLESAFTDAGT